MFRRFKRLFPYLRAYRWTLAAGVVCLVVANYLDILVASLLGAGMDLLGLKFGALGGTQQGLLKVFALLTLGTALGAGIARYWMRWLIIGVSREIEFRFRNDFFAHLLKLSPSFYDRYRTGDLMSRSTSDMDAIRTVIGPCIMYMANTVVMVPMTMVKMLAISPLLMVYAWLPLLLLMPLVFYFKKRINVRFKRVQELMSDLSANVQETLSGIRVIKTYAREGEQAAAFDTISAGYVEANMSLTRLQAAFMPMLMVVVGLCQLALISAGAMMIIRNRLTIGDLTAFYLLLGQSIWPIASLGWVMAQIERGGASMTRVEEILKQEPDIVVPEVSLAPAGTNGHLVSARSFAGHIEIRGMTFTFPGAAKPSLKDITLDLPAGTTLGVTGPVGCGKSTLAALLARRYNPPRGTLLLDGIDILDWPVDDLRRSIGIVDQEPFLFSDSIAANIVFGVNDAAKADAEALRKRMLQAARTAQLDGDVTGFPNGYDTLLGERGINLSGGQRQRTALARALARDPALLILDDALAAVDTHTEEAILRGLKELLGSRTTILVSHRVSTMQLADRILYLEDGELIEEGTHNELLAKQGHYWTLAQRQKLAEEIEETA